MAAVSKPGRSSSAVISSAVNRRRAPGRPGRSRLVEQRPGRPKWPAIARATTAACRWLTSRLSVPPGRSTRPARQRGRRVVDDLEDAVAEHHVGAAGRDQVEQAGQVALPAGDPVGDPALLRAPGQDRQGVGARVDDGDLVAELGDPDREPAGAAADVDHRGGPVGVPAVEDVAQGVPDHGRAGGAAPLEAAPASGWPGGVAVGRHAAHPSARPVSSGALATGAPRRGVPELAGASARSPAALLVSSPAGLTSA